MPHPIDLCNYKIIIFDCDGVILNSNHIKAEAFFEVAKFYGDESADKLLEYHINNAGVSRIKKFEYLLMKILRKPLDDSELKDLLSQFSLKIKNKLLVCELDHSLKALRKETLNVPWAIVSGGDQSELREVFALRGIDSFFDRGIFGNPKTKKEIIQKENLRTTKDDKILFLGDSKYDYEVSCEFHMDFVFVSQWTNLPNWNEFVKTENLLSIDCLGSLLTQRAT